MIPSYSLTLALSLAATAQSQTLGSAANFGVLGASTVTSTGLTVINGLLGVYPGTAITGFPPGIAGTQHSADAVAQAAQNDALAAYTAAAALATTQDLTGVDLGGLTLVAGVYDFSSSAGLTGILTLDGGGNPNSQFVFKIGSTLITGTGASVVLTNGAQACNVIWQVGSSATLGTGTTFVGYVIAQASVTANSAVTVDGGLYALTAAVTLIDDAINAQAACGANPVATISVVSIKVSSQPTTSVVSTKASSKPTTSIVTTKASSKPTTPTVTSKTSSQPTTLKKTSTTTPKTSSSIHKTTTSSCVRVTKTYKSINVVPVTTVVCQPWRYDSEQF